MRVEELVEKDEKCRYHGAMLKAIRYWLGSAAEEQTFHGRAVRKEAAIVSVVENILPPKIKGISPAEFVALIGMIEFVRILEQDHVCLPGQLEIEVGDGQSGALCGDDDVYDESDPARVAARRVQHLVTLLID